MNLTISGVLFSFLFKKAFVLLVRHEVPMFHFLIPNMLIIYLIPYFDEIVRTCAVTT